MRCIFKQFSVLIFAIFCIFFISSCATTKNQKEEQSKAQTESILNKDEKTIEAEQEFNTNELIYDRLDSTANGKDSESKNLENQKNKNSIRLLFGGDIMAHEENLRLDDFSRIWTDVKDFILDFDLAFANIEAPLDTTKDPSTYPNFNMPEKYVQAAIDAGFSVFSLCNNHTNDQGAAGIKETIKTSQKLTKENLENGKKVYFAGLKESEEAEFTWHFIEKNGWKILFLPVTELLNRPAASELVNFVRPDEKSRKSFKDYCRELRKNNPCDLFVLSLHTAEPEYTRKVTKEQEQFYFDLLECGVDVLWANHAHIIKDRKFVFDSKTGAQKIIMFANGNTISGQRRAPALDSKNPDLERDNTGDGLLYEVIFTKQNAASHENESVSCPQITFAKPHYITTYIDNNQDFLLKPLNENFIKELNNIPRKNWAEYISRRKKITEESTKDYIIWQ